MNLQLKKNKCKEIMQTPEISIASSSSLNSIGFHFVGVFRGRENEIRITPDNKVSVYDFIKLVCGQRDDVARKTWSRILEKYKGEIEAFCHYYKFGSKKETPVISAQGLVKLLMWLPGETAKLFRSACAEILVRYLGGDVTLIDEIQAIDQFHTENPENPAAIFRKVLEQRIFSWDQINMSKKLIAHFGNKNDIFYMFSFFYNGEWYVKFGIVGELREFHVRIAEHIAEFGEICFHCIIQCAHIDKVESDFKTTAMYTMNKAKIPKKSGTGNHIEIIKLSEIITTGSVKEEIIKTAGDRMLDPPPIYTSIEQNIDIEREKTKQIEIQTTNITKQKEIEMKIRIMELEVQKMQIDLEKSKLLANTKSPQNDIQDVIKLPTPNLNETGGEESSKTAVSAATSVRKTKQQGIAIHTCPICSRTLSRSDGLKAHILTHSKEKNHVCSECGDCFRVKQGLTDHQKTHSTERPYKCDHDLCLLDFKRKSTLTRHQLTHLRKTD